MSKPSPQASRRRFLTTSSAIAAGYALGGFYTGRATAAQQKRQVGVALVGLGNLATNQLAPALQKTQHMKLVGIVSGTPEKRQRWSQQYDIPEDSIYTYETYDRIADNDKIDCIYVVLPNGMHAEYTIRAAEAGKHVFCEKPMANSSAECRQMIAACEQADRLLGIGYRCQFEPHHQECIRLAREQEFGPLKAIRAGFGFKIGDPNQWRLDGKLAGGGALMDVGIYALQACRYLTGSEPDSITAVETKTDPEKFAEVDETIAWTMKMPGDICCDCSTTYAFNGINQFRAYGPEGNFGLDPAYSYTGITGTTSRGPIAFDPIDQFAAEMDHFAQCILDGTPCRVPGEEGLRDLLAIEAIYEAVRSGSAVTPQRV